ncbi:unnamed protein product, partial [Porites lobata]
VGASLDTLTSNLIEFPHLKEHFSKVWSFKNSDDMKLLCQKGVYPYSYMNSFSKFAEKSLPTRGGFKNDLSGDDLPEEKYEVAQRVWKTTGCKSMGDYHDLYLYHDIFLLADVFDVFEFRHVALKNYDLDPAHYYTVPGLAWDAALKYTKVKQAMTQALLVGEFKRVPERRLSSLNVMAIADDAGYILEVDLEYPAALHDHHSDYPLAPEKIEIMHEMFEVFVNDEEKQEYFVGLEAKRTSVKLDKPIYTGFTVFELSKLHMYDFHYNHIMKKYGPEKAKLLFTDTDSLTYHIKTDDLYQDTKQD